MTFKQNPEKAHAVAHKAEEKVKGIAGQAKEAASSKKVFTGGEQGFVSLKLEEVETVSPNTKKFKFSFPEPDQVSGLQVACTLVQCIRDMNGLTLRSCAFDEI